MKTQLKSLASRVTRLASTFALAAALGLGALPAQAGIRGIPTCPDYASLVNIQSGSTAPSAVGAEYYEHGSVTNLMVRLVTSTNNAPGQAGYGQDGYAQDVFLGGEHIDLGLHRNGAFGTRTEPNTNKVHTWSGQVHTHGMRASMTGWGDTNSCKNVEGYVVYMCPRCGYTANRTEKVTANIKCPNPDCHYIGQGHDNLILRNDVNGSLTRDFFTPGTKDEGWLITTGGSFNTESNLVGATDTARGQQGYGDDCNGTNLVESSTALSAKVYYKGNGGVASPGNTNMTLIAHTELKTINTDNTDCFKITQVVEFQKYDTGYDTWVTISNMTDTVQKNVCYFRGFDPDQPSKWYQGSKYNTDNFYWTDPETHDAYVICSATNSQLSATTTLDDFVDRTCTPFYYYAPDPQNDPLVERKYTITPVTMKAGWSASKEFSTPQNGYHSFYDTAMGIRFNIGDLGPGESVRLYYYSSLDPCAWRAFKRVQNRVKTSVCLHPQDVANATMTSVTMNTDGTEATGDWVSVDPEEDGSYRVWSNNLVQVTYKANEGYVFGDALTESNVVFTATTDPVSVPPELLPVALPLVDIKVEAPDHTTAAVYRGKVDPENLVTDGKVVTNGIAYVVYTINEGWYFSGWTKAVTNQLDTTVNPAVDTNALPAVIKIPSIKLGDVAQRWPWNDKVDVEVSAEDLDAETTYGLKFRVFDVVDDGATTNEYEFTSDAAFTGVDSTNATITIDCAAGGGTPALPEKLFKNAKIEVTLMVDDTEISTATAEIALDNREDDVTFTTEEELENMPSIVNVGGETVVISNTTTGVVATNTTDKVIDWTPYPGGVYEITVGDETFTVNVAASLFPYAELPTAASGLVYNGGGQTLVTGGSNCVAGASIVATNAGPVEIHYTPAPGFVWTDNTTEQKSVSVTIAQKPLTITAEDKIGAIGTNPNMVEGFFTFTYDGFVGSDTNSAPAMAKLPTATTVYKGEAIAEESKTYAIVPSGAVAANYNVTFVPGVLTVVGDPTVVALQEAYGDSFDYDLEVQIDEEGVTNKTVILTMVKDTGALELEAQEENVTIMLNLNGHTVCRDIETEGEGYSITVPEGSVVCIYDLSANSDGKIVGADVTVGEVDFDERTYSGALLVEGEVLILDGVFDGAVDNAGKLTIYGGTYSNKTMELWDIDRPMAGFEFDDGMSLGEKYVWEQNDDGSWSVVYDENAVTPDPIGPATDKVTVFAIAAGSGAGKVTPNVKSVKIGRKVTLKAKAAKGSVFAGWYLNGYLVSQETTYKVVTDGSAAEVTYVAQFILKEQDTEAKLRVGEITGGEESERVWLDEVQEIPLGVEASYDLKTLANTATKVSVTSLPSGLKFDKKTMTISGAPTRAQTKTAKITLKNASNVKSVYTVTFDVKAMPDWSVGSFDGVLGTRTVALDPVSESIGSISLTVAKTGRISGKVLTGGRTYSFSAKHFDAYDVTATNYVVTVTPKSGKYTLGEMTIAIGANDDGIGVAECTFDDEDYVGATMFGYAVQNVWKRTDLKGSTAVFPTGRKALSITLAKTGLVAKFGKNGKVRVSGKVAGDNGKAVSVSCSAQLQTGFYNEATGENALFLLYVAPKKNLAEGICEVIPLAITTDDNLNVTDVQELVGE